VKGVRNAGHEVIGHIRLWVRTRPVFSLGSGRVAELTGLWLVEVTGCWQFAIHASGVDDVAVWSAAGEDRTPSASGRQNALWCLTGVDRTLAGSASGQHSGASGLGWLGARAQASGHRRGASGRFLRSV
jgi:hypothetical protein